MPGNSKERNVVLNFKMDGQVQYANTLKQINMVMNNAAKEYKNHIAAMGQDATMTDKLLAEKKKLEIQMEAAKKRTAMLRSEYQAMSKDTSTTAEQLNKMYGKLLDAERAETSLDNAMKRVNEGLSEQAIEAREARGTLLDLQENSKKLEAEQKRLTSSFKLQNAELGQNASEADKLELAQKQLRQQMEMTDRVVHNLEQQLSAAKRVYGENSTEVQQLEAKLNQAKTTLKQFENSLQSVGRSGSQAADGMAEINKKLDMNNLMEAAEVLQGISEKLIEMGKSIVNTAIEFDGSQRKIQASLGLTGKGAENLQKIAVDTWKKGFAENLEDVDNALIKVYQNMRDVPYEELQMASEDVLTLAKIYDVDLNEATRGAGQLMSQFGLSTQETFDLLAAGAQEGLNYSDELFDNLSEYAPLFKQAGFTADEMFTILANGTKSGSYNLDYINDLVKEFGIRVQDGSKGVSEGFGDLSEETQKVWKSFTEGKGTAADVFNAVLDDLQKMDDKVKANQIGVALFGVKWEDMGAEAVLSLNNVHGGLGDVTGRMDEMKKLQEESLGQQFQKALRETQAALEPLGKKFAELAKDILPPIVDGIKSVMDWFSKLSEADQTLLIVMGTLSAAFIILTPIVAALAVSFGALDLALLPVIATIAAVSLVITGIIMLIKNWGAITDWLSEKWSQFKDWFGDLWSGIVQACSDGWSATVDYFSGAWSDFFNMVNEFFQPIGQFFTDLWTGISDTASEIWTSITDFFSESWSSFIELADSILSPLGEFFSELWTGIVETATSIWDQLKTAWQETWNTIVTVLDPIISLISTVLEAGWLLIQAGAQIAWAAISQYIIQPIQEAYDWVSKQIGELITWLSTQWEIAKAAAQVAWGLFKQYITQPVQEAWNWVKEQIGELVSWLNSQWETVKSYTSAAWNLVKQYVIQPVQELWNATKEKLNDLANWILGNWAKIQSYTLTAWNLVYKYIIDPVISAYNSAKEKFNDMYNTAREKFDSVKNAAQEKFDAAKRFIVDPIKDAVEKVQGFIEKIKGFFNNLTLKIPKPEMPKMPHFSLETSTKNILGKDITYPSGIGVQWRAKGGIFTRPTIFGMNNGQLQGAGEAGNEAVLPLNKKTLGAIGEGIAATMSTEPTVVNIYNPSVRDDRDIDRMVGKIDDALAQKGRNSKIGIGRTT
ncbi:phage tail tape measure protein [Bacillus paranthracis]|uniref:phage tail tape measure protein n=1 Tax=Bacillus paranthracis TaxID=2026186 RepID=UPI000200EA26|nr:phage tail tape measure protein [Bacillus paranthracis]ADY24086.1 Phage protein [Bacillus thuringiensis serovar finitimus YBT-020]MRC74308.1 phage tail tape measure protein [Bacillus thuringiensis]OTX67102.1 phage tail tape measure protein [Bacillus thuringiensis serovar finitimus]MCR6800388.1 phage tail tape measure protein [Bacillus paranthracis]MEC3360715.1 phage tail tape measure protein [Bacillus paranthracis]